MAWWGGEGEVGFLKADTESEMEHVAYREISTECSLMNAPLYLCYNGKKEIVGIFFFSFYHSLALVRDFSLETRDVRGFQIVQRRAARHIKSQCETAVRV